MTPCEVASAALAEVGYKLTPVTAARGGTVDEVLAIPPDLLLRAANLGRMSQGAAPLSDALKAVGPSIRTQYAERWGLTWEAAR